MNRRKEVTADAAGSGVDNSAPLVLPMGGPVHSRNYGIDFLRCLSMFFVVLLHVLKWGEAGNLANNTQGTPNYAVSWFLELSAFCAVNSFALITGYVGVRVPHRISRFINLWFQVFFYTVGITFLFKWLMPGSVNLKGMFQAFFPVLRMAYWYFTAYAVLFFFIPFLNTLIRSLGRESAKWLCLLIFIIFSLLSTISGNEDWLSHGGYSAIWLGCLYVAGGCISHFQLWSTLKRPAFYYLLCCLLATAGMLAWDYLPFRQGISEKLFAVYTAPFCCLCSFFLLQACARMRITSRAAIRLISLLAPFSFAVYLIHSNPLVWHHVMKGRFAVLQDSPWYIMAAGALGISLGIYLACSMIDSVRSVLFRLLHIRELSVKLEAVLSKLKQWILRSIPS